MKRRRRPSWERSADLTLNQRMRETYGVGEGELPSTAPRRPPVPRRVVLVSEPSRGVDPAVAPLTAALAAMGVTLACGQPGRPERLLDGEADVVLFLGRAALPATALVRLFRALAEAPADAAVACPATAFLPMTSHLPEPARSVWFSSRHQGAPGAAFLRREVVDWLLSHGAWTGAGPLPMGWSESCREAGFEVLDVAVAELPEARSVPWVRLGRAVARSFLRRGE